MQHLLVGMGRSTLAFFVTAGRITLFSGSAILSTLRSWRAARLTFRHASSFFLRCIVPVTLVIVPIGAMLCMQSVALTQMFGVDRLLSPLITATVIRELSPGFSAVMIAFQAGAGVAAELGTMRVQQELDALDVMGVDARQLIVGPRILGATLAAPLLNGCGIFLGVAAAWLVAVGLYQLPHGQFADHWLDGLHVSDLWISQLKSAIFGFVIGSVSSTFGFHAQGGPAGVGQSANRTVVVSVIVIMIANYLLNTALFGLRGGGLL